MILNTAFTPEELKTIAEAAISKGMTVEEYVKAMMIGVSIDEEEDHEDAKGKGKKQKFPRINMAFYNDNHKYLAHISRICGVSITQYVNDLVSQDRLKNREIIEKAREVMRML